LSVTVTAAEVGDLAFLIGEGPTAPASAQANSFHLRPRNPVSSTDTVSLTYFNSDSPTQDPANMGLSFLVKVRTFAMTSEVTETPTSRMVSPSLSRRFFRAGSLSSAAVVAMTARRFSTSSCGAAPGHPSTTVRVLSVIATSPGSLLLPVANTPVATRYSPSMSAWIVASKSGLCSSGRASRKASSGMPCRGKLLCSQ
jgi:hypothetical protein